MKTPRANQSDDQVNLMAGAKQKYGNSRGSAPKLRQQATNSKNVCYRCGREGHFGRQCEVARGKICKKCGKEGHLATMCRTTITKSDVTSEESGLHGKTMHQRTRTVNMVAPHQQESSGEDSDYVYALDGKDSYRVKVSINDNQAEFLADTGASVNVMTKQVWLSVKRPSER